MKKLLNNLENDKVSKRVKADVQKEVEEFFKTKTDKYFCRFRSRKKYCYVSCCTRLWLSNRNFRKDKIIEEYLQKDEFKKLIL